MADKTLVCSDCGNEFVFTEGEQAFYAEKGFTNEPKRCPECRKARKQQRFNKNQENYLLNMNKIRKKWNTIK